MVMQIGLDELSALALGAGVLGTGGGGDPYLGRLAAQHEFEKNGAPRVVHITELTDDMLVVPVAMGGAPAIGLEKLLSEPFLYTPIRKLESYLGRKVDALVPLEIGGVNALLPFMMGSRLNLPVVDGDSMGRAYPTLDNTTFNIFGLRACPVVVTNEHGDTVIVDTDRNHLAEIASRSAITDLGGATCSALYPMSGADAKRTLIPGTVGLALSIGRAIEGARQEGNDPFVAIAAALAAFDPRIIVRPLFEGKVTDIVRSIEGGFNKGYGTLTALEGWTGELQFVFQNEYLRAMRNGRTIAIVPDLICCLDSATAEPVTCETLRYGQRLKMLGISAPPVMRTEAGLAACGPTAFGLDEPYVAID